MPSTYRHIGEAAPYYDDYVGSRHDDKGYVKVLWKPSRAVQARELTQMQTYSQNQIASLGGYLFKDGTVVQGGIISTTTKQKYFIGTVSYPAGMDLEDVMAGFSSNNKVGKTIGDENLGNQGLYPTGIDEVKIQIVGWTTRYDSDGGLSLVSGTQEETGITTTNVVVFYNILGGSFARIDPVTGEMSGINELTGTGLRFSSPIADVDATLTVTTILNPSPTSIKDLYLTCTCAGCTKGTIFVDGYFVNCPLSYIMINPINVVNDDATGLSTLEVESLDSGKNKDVEFNIGYWIDRKIVNSYDDETLSDPAGGTYNHKAPGADRYSILAKLKCFSSDEIAAMTTEGSGVDNILKVNSTDDIQNGDGATQGIKFAGGIIMKNNVVIKEQSNIGTNAGLMDEMARRTYEESGNYTVRPWKVQLYEKTQIEENNLETTVPDEYLVSVNPGLGYIQGYRVSTCVSQVLPNTKSRTTLLRSNNSKFTEEAMHVLSDDIYTLNNVNNARDQYGNPISPSRNINTWHIENVMSAQKAILLDRKISEILKVVDPDSDDSWTSYSPSDSNVASLLRIDSSAIKQLGSCTVIDVSSDGWYNLKISVLDVEGTANLSNVSSIASFDENGKLNGYIDLLHDEENGNTTLWKNVEAPLIFEMDWKYVAPHTDTTASFVCNAFVKSTGPAAKAANEATAVIPFNTPVSIGSPQTTRAVNFLVDETTGEIIPASKIAVEDNTTDTSFNAREISSNILTVGHNYWISYQGDGTVVASKSVSTDDSTSRTFKEKHLAIGSMELSSSDIGDLIARYNASEGTDDTLELKIRKVSISANNVLSYSESFVTDLVKILSIEQIDALSADNVQTNSDANTELYWNVSDGMEGALTISNGCRDSRYEAPTIKGLAAWCLKKYGDGSITDGLRITFAYWKHIGSGSFYYAGSYKIDSSAQFSTTDSTDRFVERLAESYGVRSIGPNDGYLFIPKYQSASGSWYDLATCIDCRPDYDPSTTSNENAQATSNSTTNSNIQIVPIPASRIRYNIHTYLPRIDSLTVDRYGKFEIVKGIPSDHPLPPKENNGTMVLYHIYNQPYGKTLDNVILKYINNNRHTMVDINALADRLSNLEQVVSMSMSEQSAVNMQITDEDGISRYKCGIFTENFGSYGACDYKDSDWSATIDGVEQCIRSEFDLRDWSFSPTGLYLKNDFRHELDTLVLVSDDVSGQANQVEARCEVFGKTKSTSQSESIMTGGTILTISPKVNDNWDADGCPSPYSWPYAKNEAVTESTNLQALMFVIWNGNLVLTPAIDTWVNDLGDVVTTTEVGADEKAPPPVMREWEIKTDGTEQEEQHILTIPSGLTRKQIDAMYGDSWKNIPVDQRLTHVRGESGIGGWWEPATTISNVTTYKTVTTTKVTETTTFNADWKITEETQQMTVQDEFMRVRHVQFDLQGMRPNQVLKARMDNVDLKLITVEEYAKPEVDTNGNAVEKVYTSTITTSDKGTYTGYFLVPEGMPVGSKIVEFYDDEETTTATADYTANGKTIWNAVNRTYIRVWIAGEPTEEYGTPSTVRGDKISSERVAKADLIRHDDGDPIAESFYISEPNGITLESIQVYFKTKDPTVGVEVFIVECENGYPGKTTVPFSRAFVPASEVALVSEEEFANGSPTPTTFKFPVPIHLQGLKEYAFIVYAPSYNYEIYTSTLGKADLATGMGVREQPYVGSMFKSQNLRTWTEEQLSDITFKMYKYQFDTGVECRADFSLDDLATRNTGLETTLPGSGQQGEASGEFTANSATISIGTYIPVSTSIDFKWFANSNVQEAKPFVNKQSIFFDEVDGFALSNIMETRGNRTTNKNASFKVRAILTTSDANVAPQIDLEDFHGIFTRNAIEIDKDHPAEIINGLNYYDAGTYVSNTIALKNPAIGMNVAIDAMLPSNGIIKAYMKTTGALKQQSVMWTPAMDDKKDYLFHPWIESNGGVNLEDDDTIQKVLLPGYQDYAWKELMNERVYLWYYILDTSDTTTKFILPNQEAHFGSSLDGYSHSSCIIKNASTIETVPAQDDAVTNGLVEAKAQKLILQDPVNLDIIASPTSYTISSDASQEGGKKIVAINYNAGSTASSCIILGVIATPSSEAFDPDALASNSRPANGSNYAGISCAPYNNIKDYEKGELCLYNGSIWMCKYNDVQRGLSPSDDALYWERIPCALMASGKILESNSDSQWMELDVDDYKTSTEREKNFMEYVYSLASSLEINEFDSYILKLRMLTVNRKDIPRFRNLRAVAVY